MSALGEARDTLAQTRNSASKFYKAFWGTENDDDNDDDGASSGEDEDAIKSVSGSSSLDADGGSCGPGDDAFCVSNILWLSAAGFVTYQSDFFDAVLISPWRGDGAELNLLFYWIGMLLLSINFCIFYYLVVHLSWNRGVKSDEWDSHIPYAVPVATISFVGSTLFLSIGLWPRWGVLTVPILSTVFMGFIVVISMASQVYKWRRFGSDSQVEKKRS